MRKISLCFLICLVLFSPAILADFTLSAGYVYLNVYDTLVTTFAPFIGLEYILSDKDIDLAVGNSFFYSTDSFFLNNLYLTLYLNPSGINQFNVSGLYTMYDLFLVNDAYHPGSLISGSIGYRYENNIILSVTLDANYIKLLDVANSPLLAELTTTLILPGQGVYGTGTLVLGYEGNDTFSSNLLTASIDWNLSMFLSLKEALIPGIRVYGGYSPDNTRGNFYGFKLYNRFTSLLSSNLTFINYFYADLKSYLTSIIADEVNTFMLNEEFGFAMKLAPEISYLNEDAITFVFYPQLSGSPSTDNHLILQTENDITYSFNTMFLIMLDTTIAYYNWMSTPANNYNDMYFSLSLKFLPAKALIFNLVNSFNIILATDGTINQLKNETKFNIRYDVITALSLLFNLSFKSYIDKAVPANSKQYLYLELTCMYGF